jgi:hypothetical protein
MTHRPRVFITGGRRGGGRGIAYGSEAGYDGVINDIVGMRRPRPLRVCEA